MLTSNSRVGGVDEACLQLWCESAQSLTHFNINSLHAFEVVDTAQKGENLKGLFDFMGSMTIHAWKPDVQMSSAVCELLYHHAPLGPACKSDSNNRRSNPD
jgi:hypothetical protein